MANNIPFTYQTMNFSIKTESSQYPLFINSITNVKDLSISRLGVTIQQFSSTSRSNAVAIKTPSPAVWS